MFRTKQLATWMIFGCLITLSGCMVDSADTKDLDAQIAQLKTTSVSGAASNCAMNAFRLAVHPPLMNSCNMCHSGSHGSSNVTTAYNAVKGKTDLSIISNSSIINRASQAGHCGSCGPSFGASLSSLMGIWAKAERGDAATCADYAAADPGTPGVKPFDLGSYVPPNPNDTIIVSEGVTEFGSAGGVHDLLVNNCRQCHVPGGLSSFAPFAVADINTSYRESKPRANFANVSASLLYLRASVPNHGGGCSICGNSNFLATLYAELSAWASREANATQTSIVKLTSNSLSALPPTGSLHFTYNLDANSIPAHNELAGATMAIDVSFSNSSTYRFANPVIKAGSRPVRVKKISFVFGGTLLGSITSYQNVDLLIPANTTKTLATFPALVPVGSYGTSFQLQFEILEGQ